METIPVDRLNAESTPLPDRGKSRFPMARIIQRYFVPRFLVMAYYYFRYGCLVSSQARVQMSGRISFGRGTVVKPFAVIQTTNGRISFGRDCAVSSFDHISTSDGDVIVGDNVRIGPNVTITGSGRIFRDRNVLVVDQGYSHGGVTIGNDVLIGAGAVILDGCRIGDGAVIGAGCVVNRDVPPYSIVVGVPARVVGERT